MSYAQQNAGIQNNQIITLAVVMFVTIVAAITFSAILVSTMVKGEVAKALSNNTPVTTAQSINAPVSPAAAVVAGSSCVAPTAEEAASAGTSTTPATGSYKALPWTGFSSSFVNSFNNTQTSTTNTTTTNTVNKNRYTAIVDSFKVGTDNVVVTGNTVASNNNANSNNSINSNNSTNIDNTNNSVNNSVVGSNVDNSDHSDNSVDNSNNSTNNNQVAVAVGLVAAAVNVD